MKIFLDTNILVSAFTARGICAELFRSLLRQHLAGRHALLLGDPVLAEFIRIMRDKFRVAEEDLRVALATLDELTLVDATAGNDIPAVPDPDDVPILACALAARVELFVTGDKEVLELRQVESMRIVTPREAWLILFPVGNSH